MGELLFATSESWLNPCLCSIFRPYELRMTPAVTLKPLFQASTFRRAVGQNTGLCSAEIGGVGVSMVDSLFEEEPSLLI